MDIVDIKEMRRLARQSNSINGYQVNEIIVDANKLIAHQARRGFFSTRLVFDGWLNYATSEHINEIFRDAGYDIVITRSTAEHGDCTYLNIKWHYTAVGPS